MSPPLNVYSLGERETDYSNLFNAYYNEHWEKLFQAQKKSYFDVSHDDDALPEEDK